jgi:hypothetical protein
MTTFLTLETLFTMSCLSIETLRDLRYSLNGDLERWMLGYRYLLENVPLLPSWLLLVHLGLYASKRLQRLGWHHTNPENVILYNIFFFLFLHAKQFPYFSLPSYWFPAPTLKNGNLDSFLDIQNPHYFLMLNFTCLETNVSEFPEQNTLSPIPYYFWYTCHVEDKKRDWRSRWELCEDSMNPPMEKIQR